MDDTPGLRLDKLRDGVYHLHDGGWYLGEFTPTPDGTAWRFQPASNTYMDDVFTMDIFGSYFGLLFDPTPSMIILVLLLGLFTVVGGGVD